MFDDEVIQQEEVVQEQPQEQVEAQEATQPEQIEASPKKKPQESWKEMRDRVARAEREKAELARRLQEIEAAKSAAPDEDLEINIGADDLAEGKHLAKVDKKYKKLSAEMQRLRDENMQISIENQLRRQYKDFDDVVSESNVAKLRDAEPELFDTITAGNDLYKKGVSAYKMIKKLGLDVEEEDHQVEHEVVKKNLAKPRPLVSGSTKASDSPLTNANAFARGLTPELKKQLWDEMQNLRRHSGFSQQQ